MKDFYKQLGPRKAAYVLLLVLVIGGIGGAVMERAVFPFVSQWPILKHFDFLQSDAPILITKREEVRIQEGINVQEILNKVRGSLVSVYFHRGEAGSADFAPVSSTPGFIVTSDGIIVVPSGAVESGFDLAVLVSDGRVFEASLETVDQFTGLAFLKIESADLPVLGEKRSSLLRPGEDLFAVSTDGMVSGMRVLPLVLTGQSIPEQSLAEIVEFGILHAFVPTNRDFSDGELGAAVIDRNGALVGAVAEIRGEKAIVRSEEMRLLLNKFLSSGEVEWPQVRITYLNLDGTLARLRGLPDRTGILVRGAVTPLRRGDFVYAVDGVNVSAEEGFQHLIMAKDVGSVVKLKLIRAGEEMEIELVL